MYRRALWLLLLGFGLGAFAPAGAQAAPRQGLWAGYSGIGQVSFVVAGSRLTELVIACNYAPARLDTARLYRIGPGGGLNPSKGGPPLRGRLGTRTAELTLVMPPKGCGQAKRDPIKVRAIPPPRVRDGVYRATGPVPLGNGGFEISFRIDGSGGVVRDFRGRVDSLILPSTPGGAPSPCNVTFDGLLPDRAVTLNERSGSSELGFISARGAGVIAGGTRDSFDQPAAAANQVVGTISHRGDASGCVGNDAKFVANLVAPEGARPTLPREPPGGYGGVPSPSGGPGCQPRVAAGPVELTASCFRRRADGSFAAEGRVRLNGIDLVPAGATGEIVFDPKALELRARGAVRAQVGPVVLYEGSLERKLGASFTLRVPSDSSVKGFPVNGEARITLRSGAAEIDANVGIPALGGVSGAAKLNASTAGGLRLDALSLKVPRARVGAVPIKDAALSYSRTSEGDLWTGGATIELPGPKIASLTGQASFLDGRFASASGELAGPGVAVFPGIFITKVRAGLTLEPQFGFKGGMALSAGPKVLGATAASVDGTFEFVSGAPALFRLSGDISLVKLELASGQVEYRTNGQVNLAGNLDLEVGGVGFEGDLAGFVDGLRAFNAEGSGTVGFKGRGLSGQGLVSSTGTAACAKLRPFRVAVGFGVSWKSFPKPTILASSCDVADWRAGPAARAAALAPGQKRAFRVRRGSRVAAFAARGVGGAPNVTLRGPGDTVVATPAGAEATTIDDGRLAFRNPDDATTYFAIPRPRAGRWTLTVEAGSVPVSRTLQAGGRPRLRIRARVIGRGPLRRLRYRVGRQTGLRVTFYERSGGAVRRLTSTRGGRGSVRFGPAPGGAVRRQIMAVATQGGIPRDRLRVARFEARVPRPGRPRRVRVRRRNAAAVVTWSRSRRAVRHLVRVRVSDGRRLLFMPRHKRRVLVRRVGGRPVVATVRGLDSAGRAGPTRRARSRR